MFDRLALLKELTAYNDFLRTKHDKAQELYGENEDDEVLAENAWILETQIEKVEDIIDLIDKGV